MIWGYLVFLVELFIPPSAFADRLALARSRSIVMSYLFTSFIGGSLVAIYLFLKPSLETFEIISFLGCALTPIFGALLVRLTGSFRRSLTLTNVLGVIFLTGTAYYSGGVTSPTAPWFLANLALLATFGDRRTIFAINGTLLLALSLLFFIENFGFPPPHVLPENLYNLLFFLSMVGATLMIGISALASLRSRQRTKDTLNKAREEAEAGSQAKSEFLSTMSHELRTPLTSIIGAIGLMRGGALGKQSERVGQMVDIAYSNSKRLTYLINDILDIEKIESGQLKMDITPLKIMQVVKQSIDENHGYFTQHEVQATIIDDTKDCLILGDKGRLLQVMANLLSNGSKYSPKGSELAIEVQCDDECVTVSVTNQGPEIPKEFHDKIFDRFVQVDSSDTRKIGGTGLGLNISKAIITHLKGTINFTCDPNKGTCFFFKLPRHKSDE